MWPELVIESPKLEAVMVGVAEDGFQGGQRKASI